MRTLFPNRSLRSLLVVPLLCVPVVACDGTRNHEEAATETVTRVSVLGNGDNIPLGAPRRACNQCVMLRPLVTIGDDDGPGFLIGAAADLAQTSTGEFVVPQGEELKVFRLDGTYLRSIGRSGQGPIEFQFANKVLSDASGRLHVFDPSNARHSRLSAELEYESSHRLPGQVTGVVAAPNEDALILNMSLSTPALIGQPMHKVSADNLELTLSFGLRDGPVIDVRNMQRILTADRRGRVYATKMQSKEVEVWTTEGRFLGSLIRPGKATEVPSSTLSPEAELPELTMGMSIDGVGRLWVFTWVPREDWRTQLVPYTRGDGRTGFRAREGNKSLYSTLIEVIDPDEGLLIAETRFDAPLYKILSDTLIIGVDATRLGAPRLQLWGIDRTPQQ